MNIYQFQNYLYLNYEIKTRLDNLYRILYIEVNKALSNSFRRAIGEEISDFLKNNKQYVIQPWLKIFDDWKYNNV